MRIHSYIRAVVLAHAIAHPCTRVALARIRMDSGCESLARDRRDSGCERDSTDVLAFRLACVRAFRCMLAFRRARARAFKSIPTMRALALPRAWMHTSRFARACAP